MTTLNRTWGHLSLRGKVIIPLLFLVLVVGPILTILLATVVGPFLADLLGANLGIVRFVVGGRGRPGVHHPDRVHHHLHGAQGHRRDEPAGRAGPGRARRVA